MKIKCSYCGALIDIEAQSNCHMCGASINDEQYQKYSEMKNESRAQKEQLEYQSQQADIQRKKIENERLQTRLETERNSARTISTIRKIQFIYFIPVFLGIITFFFSIFRTNNTLWNSTVVNTEPTTKVQYQTAEIGETVYTKDYTITLDEWDYFEPQSYAIQNGEKYVKFHFVYTNISDHSIADKNTVYCYADNGKMCKVQYSLSINDAAQRMSQQIVLPGKSYAGWCYFIVPQSSHNLTVVYDENIEINIDLEG
jgi:hypothetical protein